MTWRIDSEMKSNTLLRRSAASEMGTHILLLSVSTYFSSPLVPPTESDYHGLDEGTFLSVHFSTTEFRSAGQIHLEAIETINDIFRCDAPVYSSLMEAANTYPDRTMPIIVFGVSDRKMILPFYVSVQRTNVSYPAPSQESDFKRGLRR